MGKLKHAPPLLLGAALIAVIFGAQYAIRARRDPRVAIGKDEVYYYRGATSDDALALADALRKIGYLDGRGTSVLLWKGTPTIVSFTTSEGGWSRPNAVSNFTEIGRRISGAVGGFPFQVDLIDAGRTVHRKMNVGKVTVGAGDILYYFGDATRADADTLAQALQSAGYFSGLGFTVALLKGEGTVLSFVVQDGAWDQPAVVATLGKLVHGIAPAVGGLPVRLRLLNNGMEIRNEAIIR